MKKVSLLLAAFALVMGLSQCKKPNLPVLNAGETQHVVINASWDNGGAKIDQNGTLFKWTIGDKLTVSGGATGNLTCTDVTEGTFEGDITKTSEEKVIFTFKSAKYKDNYMEQTVALNDAVYLTGEVPYSTLGKCDVPMTMPHAVLKLNLSALGTPAGTPVTIKVVGGDPVASVKNVKNDEASKALYVAVPASPAGKQYEFVSIIGTARCDDVWALKDNTFYTLKNGEGAAIVITPACEFIDLGLESGTLWSETNLNASSATEYGLYYQFGSTTGHDNSEAASYSTWSTAPFNGGSSTFDATSWNAHKASAIDSDGNWKQEYDAAYQQTYGLARTPTQAQIDELCALENEWTNDYNSTGVHGRIFHGNNGKTLFIPAAGCYYDGNANYVGQNGVLVWSRTVNGDENACYMYSWDNAAGSGLDAKPRYYSYPIRPVKASGE